MSFFPPFTEIEWFRLKVEFVARKSSSFLKTKPLCVMETINKAVSSLAWKIKGFPEEFCKTPIFHFQKRRFNFRLYPGHKYLVEFYFTQVKKPEIEIWIQKLREYFSVDKNCQTFLLFNIGEPEKRNIQHLYEEFSPLPEEGEICLEFLTPVYFKPKKNKNRYFMDSFSFLRGLQNRFQRLFDISFPEGKYEDFQTLPYYWDYTEIARESHSQPGHVQYINGCFGPLYLKGNFKKVWPWLLLASELHAGSKLSNSQGYFIIHKDSQPFFDRHFPQEKILAEICTEVIDRYDNALLELSQKNLPQFDRFQLAASLAQELKAGSYNPSPSVAYLIKSGVRKERLVEQHSYYDLIVGLYLLRLLNPVLDKAFEPESIGFRKGKSREKSIELVQKALQDGYSWLVEADIEDFFPQINLEILEKLLEFYIPSKDRNFKNILLKVIKKGYILNGEIKQRTRGLSVGHPLSPCLANLYLDSFDEAIKELGARIIRYADDFIIFCKTRGEAELILDKIQSLIAQLDLKLKKEKTDIKNAADGFQFLGFNFTGRKGEVFLPPETRLLKKPLYLTEPYIFLTVNSNALVVKKKGEIVYSVPLRRISEIMIMEKSVFSSTLIAKCTKMGIPITVALNSGYFINTIRPDSKQFFLRSSLHAQKYFNLSEAELLDIAKDIALSKMNNYQTLFQQRYQVGFNRIFKVLKRIKERLESAGSLEEVRGLEGYAARQIYSFFNIIIDNPAFHIRKRQRRPPDRINSLLNFGSYLLFSRLNAALRAAGLNPYLGFLHSPADNYESLVSDLVDIFRPRLERFIVRLINLKVITESDFVENEGGFYLNKEGKHKYLSHFEAELNRHPKSQTLPLKNQLALQVQIIKNWVEKDGSLIFYRWEK